MAYGYKTHLIDSQNSDITARGGRELYHLQFWLLGGQSGNFWIHPRISDYLPLRCGVCPENLLVSLSTKNFRKVRYLCSSQNFWCFICC